MRWRLCPALLACLWFGPVAIHAVAAQDVATPSVDAYGEDFPPLSFVRDGEPAGVAVDLLKRACAAAGVVCRVHITPWARAYHTAQTQRNCMVFSTIRTPERESGFLWLGPFLPRTSWLYTLSSTPFSANRLSGGDGFVIGTVYNDVSIGELRQIGVPDSAMENSPTLDDSRRKLMAGRVAAVVDTESSMRWFLKTHGYEHPRVKAVMPLGETGDYYYALNPRSDPAVARKLRDGLTAVLAARALPDIMDSYLGSSETAGAAH